MFENCNIVGNFSSKATRVLMRVLFLPPEEFYWKSQWHFSINSNSRNLQDFEVPKKFRISKFSEFQVFCWEFYFPRRVLSKIPMTFFDELKIQKSAGLRIPKKFRISKLSEFQEFWWEFCFPFKEFYRKSLWHFSINSKSKNLQDFEDTQKISNFKIFRVPEVLMRVMFPSRRVLQKSPIIFFDQFKIEKSTRLKIPKKFWILKFSEFQIFKFRVSCKML